MIFFIVFKPVQDYYSPLNANAEMPIHFGSN